MNKNVWKMIVVLFAMLVAGCGSNLYIPDTQMQEKLAPTPLRIAVVSLADHSVASDRCEGGVGMASWLLVPMIWSYKTDMSNYNENHTNTPYTDMQEGTNYFQSWGYDAAKYIYLLLSENKLAAEVHFNPTYLDGYDLIITGEYLAEEYDYKKFAYGLPMGNLIAALSPLAYSKDMHRVESNLVAMDAAGNPVWKYNIREDRSKSYGIMFVFPMGSTIENVTEPYKPAISDLMQYLSSLSKQDLKKLVQTRKAKFAESMDSDWKNLGETERKRCSNSKLVNAAQQVWRKVASEEQKKMMESIDINALKFHQDTLDAKREQKRAARNKALGTITMVAGAAGSIAGNIGSMTGSISSSSNMLIQSQSMQIMALGALELQVAHIQKNMANEMERNILIDAGDTQETIKEFVDAVKGAKSFSEARENMKKIYMEKKSRTQETSPNVENSFE